MKTFSINIPDNIEVDSRELTMMLASRLYEQGRLSLGQAASTAGLSTRTFAELLGNYNVSIFNYSSNDLSNDILNA